MIDNLGGRLGSFDRIEKELAPGACWSGFDRALGGSAFFGERATASASTPASRPEPAARPALEVGAQISLTDGPAREAA
jgi:hypothetical protein